MISIDVVRCPACDTILLLILPGQDIDLDEYNAKLNQHYFNEHDALDYEPG